MVTSMSQTEKGHQSCPLPRVTKRGGRASARQFQGHWPPSPMSCCVTLGGGAMHLSAQLAGLHEGAQPRAGCVRGMAADRTCG